MEIQEQKNEASIAGAGLTAVLGDGGNVKKRFRTPVAKEGELLVKYGKEYGDEDLFYCYPDNECGMKRLVGRTH